MPFSKNNKVPGPGRPKGKKNEITLQIKESFTMLLEKKMPEMEEWLTKLAKTNPDKALDIMLKISERFVGKITKNEITGADGKDLFEGLTFKFNTPKKEDDNE